MTRLKNVFQRQTLMSDPIMVGDVAITPQSQALAVRWPGGGWVWNRPVAVLVEHNGETERIPIVDVTRIAQLALLGLSVGFFILTLIGLIHGRRKRNE